MLASHSEGGRILLHVHVHVHVIISSELGQDLVCSFFPELFYDRGNHHEFTSLVRDLARPGELMQSATYDFEFVNVEKPYETYTGANVRLR